MRLLRSAAARYRNLKVLGHFIRNFSNWRSAYSDYLGKRPIRELRLRNGLVLECGDQDDAWALFREIFIDRCYTGEGFYKPSRGDIVADCGANIGFFTVHAASLDPRIQVHSFEPSEGTFARLERNVRVNGLQDRVHFHRFALSNRNGTLRINTAPQAGSSTAFQEFEMGGEEVSCKTLPEALRELRLERIDLLKMDVEGAEIEILEAIDNETWKRIRRIVLEYHEILRPGCHARIQETLRKHFPHVDSWEIAPDNALGIMRAWR